MEPVSEVDPGAGRCRIVPRRQHSESRCWSRKGVTKRFGGLVAVDSVDLRIPRGAIAGVDRSERRRQDDLLQHDRRHLPADRGPDHLRWPADLRAHLRLVRPGLVRPDQVTARGIARTFQNIRLFANMTALENVLIGMHSRLHSPLWAAVLRTTG